MPIVKVWFYNPAEDSSGWINKLVSKMDPPYCHCEVQFSDGFSSCIYMGTPVQLRQRTFDPQSYDCVSMTCSQKQHDLMYAEAKRQTNANIQFSTLRMTGSMMWIPTSPPANTTFCSMLCADILKAASLVSPAVQTELITPSGLHRYIQNTPVPLTTGCTAALDFK